VNTVVGAITSVGLVRLGLKKEGYGITVVIEEKGCDNVMNEEKVGGSVKIEERVVAIVNNEARGGDTVNSQQMGKSCMMVEEAVVDMKKIFDLETCIKSFEKMIKVLTRVVCVLNIIILPMLLMKN